MGGVREAENLFGVLVALANNCSLSLSVVARFCHHQL